MSKNEVIEIIPKIYITINGRDKNLCSEFCPYISFHTASSQICRLFFTALLNSTGNIYRCKECLGSREVE